MKAPRVNLSQISGGVFVPLFVVAIIAVGYFVVWPKYQGTQDTKQILDTKLLDAELREGQLQSIQSLVQEFAEKKTQLNVLDDAVPTAARIPELLANFDRLSAQSGLQLDSVALSLLPDLDTPLEDVPETNFLFTEKFRESTKNLHRLQALVKVRGSYTGFKTFFATLEQNLRLMDVEGYSIAAPGGAGELQEMTLSVNIYYHRNASPAGE